MSYNSSTTYLLSFIAKIGSTSKIIRSQQETELVLKGKCCKIMFLVDEWISTSAQEDNPNKMFT